MRTRAAWSDIAPLTVHAACVLQVAVPAYPIYRKNPIKWLDEIPDSRPPPSSRKKGAKHRR